MSTPTTPKTASFGDFYTRQKANEGIDLPLYLPGGGLSEHSIKIRGIDSDAVKAAKLGAERKLIELFKLPESEQDAALDALKLDVVVAMVISWTFPEPCTPEKVRELLTEAPQIKDAIDNIAGKRALFFGKGLVNSTTSQK
jgi:hypothetical protein